MEFKRLVPVSNWGYYMELDGWELIDGERVRVRWPDGHIDEGVVRAKRTYDSAPTSTYFLTVEYHGLAVAVQITEQVEVARCSLPTAYPYVKNFTRVITLEPNVAKGEYCASSRRPECKWGALGSICGNRDSHGLMYQVVHDDGTKAWYDPTELQFATES